MSNNAGKYIMLTNMAGIPTVAYDKSTDNIMPPHSLLSDPDANVLPQKEEKKPSKGFFHNLVSDKQKMTKVGIFSGILLLGVLGGIYWYNKRKQG